MNHHSNPQQAYKLLQVALGILLILTGIDKFFNLLVNWTQYIPGIILTISPNPHLFLMLLGIVETLVGILIFFRPIWGGYLAALLFVGMAINLLLIPGYFNTALLLVVLSMCCLAFVQLIENRS